MTCIELMSQNVIEFPLVIVMPINQEVLVIVCLRFYLIALLESPTLPIIYNIHSSFIYIFINNNNEALAYVENIF